MCVRVYTSGSDRLLPKQNKMKWKSPLICKNPIMTNEFDDDNHIYPSTIINQIENWGKTNESHVRTTLHDCYPLLYNSLPNTLLVC